MCDGRIIGGCTIERNLESDDTHRSDLSRHVHELNESIHVSASGIYVSPLFSFNATQRPL